MADPTSITRLRLSEGEVILTLGAHAARSLQEIGSAAFFFDAEGEVQMAPLWEVQLDRLEESEAIATLVGRGYNDQQLVGYLKGRDARRSNG